MSLWLRVAGQTALHSIWHSIIVSFVRSIVIRTVHLVRKLARFRTRHTLRAGAAAVPVVVLVA